MGAMQAQNNQSKAAAGNLDAAAAQNQMAAKMPAPVPSNLFHKLQKAIIAVQAE